MKKVAGLVLCLVLMLSLLAGCSAPFPSSQSQGDIQLGVFLPLTGPVGAQGEYQKKGIELAIEEINAAGGINGRLLKAVYEDTQGKKENVPNIVRKLIEQDKAVALIGEVISSCSIAAGPVVKELKVPAIAPHSTNPKVTIDPTDTSKYNPYYFRVIFTDPVQGKTLAGYPYEKLGKRRAAIIYNISQDFNKGMAEAIEKSFKEIGGQVVAVETYRDGDQDFKSQLTKIMGANPDVLFTPNGYMESGLIVRQARELGINIDVFGANALTVPKFIEIAGPAANGVYITSLFAPDDPDPQAQAFNKKYKEKFGEDSNSNAAAAYESVILLAEAMKKAKSITPEEIRNELEKLQNIKLPSGNFSFDPVTHNPKARSLVIIQVKDGKFTFVDKFTSND